MRKKGVFNLFGALLVSGCAAITPPPAYQELTERMAAAPTGESQYDDARAHLKAAEAALKDRDEAALSRFSNLGLIEARIAEARLLQMALVRTTEQEMEKSRQLEQDVAKWRSKVERLLAEQARLRMREHIEAVIEKETIAAAAAEELQSHMGDVDAEQLKTARHRVARELIAMAAVRTEIAAMLVASGVFMPEQVHGIRGAVSLMQKALADDDIASVYRYGERNLALFTDSLDSAWRVSGHDVSAASEQIEAALHGAGLESSAEDVGHVVSLSGSLADSARTTKKELNRDAATLLTQSAALLRKNTKLMLLVVVSGNGRSVATQKRTGTLVELIRQHLTTQAIPSVQFSILTLQGERPLRTLTGTGMQGALLFVPIP